jgi:CheY-like chemotaxis protein
MSDEPVILIVDDDLSLMNTFIVPFYLAGYRVITAGTLEEGRQAILREERLDMAILDMRIRIAGAGSSFEPDDIEQTNGGQLSGLFLGRFILEHRPDLPFIGLSVRADEECKNWFEQHGAGFLTKYAAVDGKHLISFIEPRIRMSVLKKTENRVPVAAPRIAAAEASVRAQELHLELTRLEREYELARLGLGKSQNVTGMGIVSVLITMLLAFGASMWGARSFLSGMEIVIIVAIVAIGLVAYMAMVFGRAARIKGRITDKEKELEMVLGDDVRVSGTRNP